MHAPLWGPGPLRGGSKRSKGTDREVEVLEGTVRDSISALLWLRVGTARTCRCGDIRLPSSFLELRVPLLRLPACSAPTLGPRRHGAVPSSARRRRCRRSCSRASRRTWPPSLSRPRLPSQHLRQHVLRFHSDVDGRAAVPVAQEPRALEAAKEGGEGTTCDWSTAMTRR